MCHIGGCEKRSPGRLVRRLIDNGCMSTALACSPSSPAASVIGRAQRHGSHNSYLATGETEGLQVVDTTGPTKLDGTPGNRPHERPTAAGVRSYVLTKPPTCLASSRYKRGTSGSQAKAPLVPAGWFFASAPCAPGSAHRQGASPRQLLANVGSTGKNKTWADASHRVASLLHGSNGISKRKQRGENGGWDSGRAISDNQSAFPSLLRLPSVDSHHDGTNNNRVEPHPCPTNSVRPA